MIGRAAKRVPPEELVRLLAHYGLPVRRQKEVPVKHGQRLWLGVFGR